MHESKVTIKIPRPLFRKIEQVVEGSGFHSPTEFIVHVLRDLLGEAQGYDSLNKTGATHGHEKSELHSDEIEALKRKLKKLGYL